MTSSTRRLAPLPTLSAVLPLGALLALLVLPGCAGSPRGPADAAPYDVAILGGRVIDPADDVDAVLNVGIRDGRIAVCTEAEIEGEIEIDAAGLVVSPGFVDLHAHGQDPVSAALQVRDGVTTALDLEAGAYPVAEVLERRRGRSVTHFGVSSSHMYARAAHFDGVEVGHGPTNDPASGAQTAVSTFAHSVATPEDEEAILALLERGLREGGLGFGMGITYTPGATRHEILRVFERAAELEAPIFVHLRGAGDDGLLAPFQEVLANAAATGAPLHVVHLNSTAGAAAREALGMIRGAREHGVDVTTEAYPYTAGSTLIQSALFDSWLDRPAEDYAQLEWPETGERLNPETFREYRARGGWVIIHGRTEELNTWITEQPDVMVASDGIPFLHGPAHPRGSGTYARVLGRYVREGQLALSDAIRKMTYLPARRLETIAPEMAHKGRLSVGADADVTIFDPETVLDRATYAEGDLPSEGIAHVLVAGTPVVRDGELIEGVFPGEPVVSRYAASSAAQARREGDS